MYIFECCVSYKLEQIEYLCFYKTKNLMKWAQYKHVINYLKHFQTNINECLLCSFIIIGSYFFYKSVFSNPEYVQLL